MVNERELWVRAMLKCVNYQIGYLFVDFWWHHLQTLMKMVIIIIVVVVEVMK
jgi:hypothetical protein